MIAFIQRSSNKINTPGLRLRTAEAVAQVKGTTLLFTAFPVELGKMPVREYATFHLRAGDTIRPLTVSHSLGTVQIFYLPTDDSSLFAAGVAATIGRLMEQEGRKPEKLHLFNGEDVYAALLVKRYFHIPFIYSVQKFHRQQFPLHELSSLGIPLPTNGAVLGDRFFPEQLAAAEAEYVIDEQGFTAATDWTDFLCAYAGKVIEGNPVVDTQYWSASLDESQRQFKKQRVMASHSLKENILVLSGFPTAPQQVERQNECAILCSTDDPAEHRALLQTADFYLFDHETGRPTDLLAAMAAGCIPVVAKTGFAADTLVSRETNHQESSSWGYFYQHGAETWVDALQIAVADARKHPGRLQEIRLHNSAFVAQEFGIKKLAKGYSLVYDGLGPVRLPFVASGHKNLQQITVEGYR
jgi:glycosyltransferase involved in cell wall biosynthesis